MSGGVALLLAVVWLCTTAAVTVAARGPACRHSSCSPCSLARPSFHTCSEAHSATNGIGLVKLMGRSAGFIALYASLASRDVNVCLIPEAPWRLGKLCTYLEERLDRSRHAVIVVAEGAESMERAEEKAAAAAAGAGGKRTDESGNPVLDDVGEYIKAGVLAHFKKRGIP